MRPPSLEEVVGQKQLMRDGKLLRDAQFGRVHDTGSMLTTWPPVPSAP